MTTIKMVVYKVGSRDIGYNFKKKGDIKLKSVQSIIIRFILLFYLTSAYLSATHIHTDAIESHNDCKICIVVKNINSGDIPNSEPETLDYLFNYEPIVYHIKENKKTILKGFNANAPPLS